MSEWKMKRFWKEATVSDHANGFAILLDGRPVKTPAKVGLVAPTEPFAQAIADEWMAQDEEIDPTAMPFTRTANAAIDKVRLQHDEVANMLAEYADSDLLCYRAEGPAALIARQAEIWDPYLDWGAETLGARLTPVTGLMHMPQDESALRRLRDLTLQQSEFELAAFHDLVSLSGSIILGFATARDVASPDEIWAASRLDELWQIEQWGADEDAEAVSALKAEAFRHAKRVWDACQPK